MNLEANGFSRVEPEPPLKGKEWVRPLIKGDELRYIENMGLFLVRQDSWWPMAHIKTDEDLDDFLAVYLTP